MNRIVSVSARSIATKSTSLTIPDFMPYAPGNTTMPWLTANEAETYLYPLFTRGWTIGRLQEGQINSESSYLIGNVRFKGGKSARSFLQELLKVEEGENVRSSLIRFAWTLLTLGTPQTKASRLF